MRPQKNVTRCLLSTSAHIVGELNEGDFLICHAWPELWAPNARVSVYRDGPTHRTFLVVSVEVAPQQDDANSAAAENYHWLGDFFAVCLGVYFGKRFDHLGLLESQGFFCLPSFASIRDVGMFALAPFNSKPRADIQIALNLSSAAAISKLLHLQCGTRQTSTFFTAGSFYLRSLQMIEDHPELAYLDLVSAGEVLSNYFEFSDERLFDKDMLALLEEIRGVLPDGTTKANSLKSRMYQVKRRFRLALSDLLNDNYFTTTEASQPCLALPKDEVEASIASAYDLRSRYVHTGQRFGMWVRVGEHLGAEKQLGTPVINDKDLVKLLVKAPTFLGLERVIRYCLLRFIHKECCPIDARLD